MCIRTKYGHVQGRLVTMDNKLKSVFFRPRPPSFVIYDCCIDELDMNLNCNCPMPRPQLE